MDTINELQKIISVGPVFIAGPTGTGKTYTARALARAMDLPLVEIHCGEISEPEDFFFRYEFRDGNLIPVLTELAMACESGKRFIVLLDELNRVQNERALNLIFGALDFRKEVAISKLNKTFSFEKAYVISTFNEGAEYNQTARIDVALMNRFIRYELEKPDLAAYAKTPLVQRICSALAGSAISYRQVDYAENLISLGFEPERAIELAFGAVVETARLREIMELCRD